ncbi:ferrous iron transport protein B [Anaeromyxobacter diazotrophicus]|uniref:Ferrous iron transport protein B n=1 Tax=Anaeromyxobacter diazotrophicus TaxID=2590199 RepID=A0A7I9VMM8_9BACT|nr:ferrous iron transport protein B [Anaeromyxobacter diazotrophicus]GEJ57247.1 ferrous iron transport protein B [Anaeromyxobacter diazotrophicus]
MTPPSSAPARSTPFDRKEVAAAPRSVILVGNPNVGKSVLFGALTGKYVTVSNYPGTTVEVTRGSAVLDGQPWHVMDTPGTNNLTPMSEDEQVTRDILMKERDYACLQVCDAKNLRRGLLLTAQLAEAGVPFVLALNMADEAKSRGFHVDAAPLAEALGVDVVPTVAVERKGLPQLVTALGRARRSRFAPRYDEAIEAALAELEPLMPSRGGLSRRALAVMALAGDASLGEHLAAELPEADLQRLEEIRRRLAARYPESLRFVVSRQRLAAVDRLHDAVVTRGARTVGSSFSRRLGGWSTHPLLGLPILLGVLFACYEFVGVFGAKTAVDFLENTVFYEHLVPWMDRLVRWAVPAKGLQEFLVGPPGVPFRDHGGFLVGRYGVFSMGLSYGMAIVLPIVTTFFIAFSVLEDSGYLPRLAVMVNKVFKRMGLNGKAVLPMVLGLGCDTMATMTARIMETRKERVIVTLLLALGVPCSAQLAVIFAMLAGVGPVAAAWFAGAVLAVLFLVGWLAAKVIPGRGSDFILELPPLRVPQAGNIAVKTLARIEWYLREALPLFVLGTLILWGLDRVHGLQVLERAAAPVVVGVLQLPKEAASAFILGFLRRDYAAAGLFMHYEPFMKAGTMTRAMEVEVVTALVTITLFIPCIANFFMILKERGWKTGVAIAGFILPFSVGVGALLNVLMRRFYL